MFARLLKWFIAYGWPWIVKNVWPAVRERVISIFEQVMADIEKAFWEWSAGRQSRQTAAERNAADAEHRARESATEADKQEQRAIARVWRQVAEDLRKENEELTAKLRELLAQAKASFDHQVKKMNVENFLQQSEDGSLQLLSTGKRLTLPAPRVSLNGELSKGEARPPKEGMVPIEELRNIARKFGLDDSIPDEYLCAAINHIIDAIMSDDDGSEE